MYLAQPLQIQLHLAHADQRRSFHLPFRQLVYPQFHIGIVVIILFQFSHFKLVKLSIVVVLVILTSALDDIGIADFFDSRDTASGDNVVLVFPLITFIRNGNLTIASATSVFISFLR